MDFVSDNKSPAPDQLFDGHYKLIRLLSEKATVANWLARDVNTIDMNASANDESSGRLVSVVICRPNTTLDIEDEQRWQDEFDAAHDCRHFNLLPPEEYAVLNDTYYLVFPNIKAESLSRLVGKSISERTVWKLIYDIASGLNELHTNHPKIIHGDIRPSNILVRDNEDFILTNYGIHFETDGQRIDDHNNDMAYTAPERFQGSLPLRPESDIWALGATLYVVLTGNKPFGEHGGNNQQYDTSMPPLSNQPSEIKDLIYACLQFNPKKRPTAQQIIDIVHSKKLFTKKKQKKRLDQLKEWYGNNEKNKKWLVTIVFLLIGVLVMLLVPRHHEKKPIEKTVAKEVPVEIVHSHYDKAVKLLMERSTANNGRKMLDSLVDEKDWQATLLMSRLYFDTRGTDTLFYDKHWEVMRDNCEIIPDNEMAHKYLFDAFELNMNDFMILYQLGCDFKAGTIRGCKRNLSYALWCFDRAENAIKSSNENSDRLKQALEYGRDRISTMDYSPSKPIR